MTRHRLDVKCLSRVSPEEQHAAILAAKHEVAERELTDGLDADTRAWARQRRRRIADVERQLQRRIT